MEFNFIKRKTKSGVVLWILPMAHYGSVSVGVAVKVGTRDETWPKEAGIAHALEHMHFQGTKNFPTSKDVTEYIEETGGRMSASTSSERTLYYTRVPSNYIDRAVNIISEQIRYALIPEEKISTEMKNIVQELRRRNDNPTRYLYYISQKFIYNNHPLSKDGLGSEESVQNFKREDFINFKKRYYDPANFIFTVVGNVNPDQAVDLFDKYFPEEIIENDRNQRPLDKIEPPETKRNIIRKDIEQTHISLGALTGKANDNSTLHLEFFADMISGGMSFPLFQEVRDKLGLCYAIGASMARQSDFGRFNIYVGTDHKRYTEAINVIFQIIAKYKADESLLEKVKKLKLGELTLDYENTGYILRSAINDIIYLGRPRGFKEIRNEIRAVNINNITESVNQYLKKDLFFTTILAPTSFSE